MIKGIRPPTPHIEPPRATPNHPVLSGTSKPRNLFNPLDEVGTISKEDWGNIRVVANMNYIEFNRRVWEILHGRTR